MPLPRLICRGWVNSFGAPIDCMDPVYQAGELGGKTIDGCMCRTCGAQHEKARQQRSRRADQRAERERRQGKTYGPAPEGVDIWRGFRDPN